MGIGKVICFVLRRHRRAVFEFAGCKPDLSTPEGCIKGIPVYRVSCPRCGVSVLYGEDDLVRDIAKALAAGGRHKVKVLQYTSGYRP